MKYRISRRETILHGSTFLPGGSELPEGIFTQKQIDEHVESGLLIPWGGERDNEFSDTGADRKLKAIKPEIEDEGRQLRMTDKKGTEVPEHLRTNADKGTTNPQAPTKQSGRWVRNPAELKGKSLQELNLLVAETDHNVEPFTTKEEAIAQLSADFRK